MVSYQSQGITQIPKDRPLSGRTVDDKGWCDWIGDVAGLKRSLSLLTSFDTEWGASRTKPRIGSMSDPI